MAQEIIEGILTGVLAAATLVYAFQTRVEYPLWLQKTFDHPWVLVLSLVLAVFLWPYLPRVAAMLIICIVAIWIDGTLFAHSPLVLEHAPVRKNEGTDMRETGFGGASADKMIRGEVWPFDQPSTLRNMDSRPGPTLADVPLPQPQYPTFFGLDAFPPGPAPF